MDKKYNYFNPNNKIYMIIIAVLILIMFYYKHLFMGLIALCAYAFLVLYNIYNIRVKKEEWKRYVEDFSSKLDSATVTTVLNLPFPLLMVSNIGKVLWYNQTFSSLIEGEEILEKNINSIIKEIKVSEIIKEEKRKYTKVKFKDRYYDIYINIIDKLDTMSKEATILVYFYDITTTVSLEKTLEENKEAVMLIEVDNLEEVVKSTDGDKKPLLIASIERNINNYAQNINAMLKKYENNKYVLTVQDKYIEKEILKKFDILNDIREIDMGNMLEVTLSIGIGRGGETPLENHKLAFSAKELALGRGGDQVVIKNGDKLLFFGGKTRELEKRTKVRARVIAHALVDLINESSNIFILGHMNPDIDCLGAAIGLNSIIRNLDKECYIILEGSNNSIKNVLNKFRTSADFKNTFINIAQSKSFMNEKSLLILVDVHSRGYVASEEIIDKIKRTVVIDHHRRSTDSIEDTLLSYIEPYASSTCELITEMIQYMVDNPKIKPMEAEALLAGICVDTKNFYFKTGVRTFEAASYLRKLGADTMDIKKLFSDDLDTYLKRADIIRSVEVINNFAIALCPPEIEDNVLAAQAADELLNITGIQASFVIVKIEDDIYISGRSLGDVNVQLILEYLGGGGHMTIAGARLKDSSIKDAANELKLAIDKYLREGEKK